MDKGERWLSHLTYEIEQMRTLARWLDDIRSVANTYPGDHGGLDDLRNACLEACLVHVRLLAVFLVGRRKEDRRGTVRRRRHRNELQPRDLHLIGAWELDDGDPAVALLDLALPELDLHLARLSKRRSGIVARLEWEPGELAAAVSTLMVRLAQLTDEVTRVTLGRALLTGAGEPLKIPTDAMNDAPRQLRTLTI